MVLIGNNSLPTNYMIVEYLYIIETNNTINYEYTFNNNPYMNLYTKV